MPFTTTYIDKLLVFYPDIYEDDRGYFFESYNQKEFIGNGLPFSFVQENQSFSNYGVIRGLHYQIGSFAQSKLVRVISGKILDVVVDIRKKSPTFKQVFSIELSSDNKKQLLIPSGFAHGFSVLSETAEITYKCDNFYDKNSERGIIFNDKNLNIDWHIDVKKQIISPKDLSLPELSNAELF